MYATNKFFLLFCLSLLIGGNTIVSAQVNSDEAYIKTITQRSNKIVTTLGISDSSIFYTVQNLLVNQYAFLNTNHNVFKEKQKLIKQDSSIQKEEKDRLIKNQEITRDDLLKKQHVVFINALTQNLTATQIEKVKDGMTYSVLPNTYKGYQEMLPNLTTAQKEKIYAYLIEAREVAIDAESSEKKHAAFGKYKGKINNYLSAEGIDMKKAGKEWEERIKAAKNASN